MHTHAAIRTVWQRKETTEQRTSSSILETFNRGALKVTRTRVIKKRPMIIVCYIYIYIFCHNMNSMCECACEAHTFYCHFILFGFFYFTPFHFDVSRSKRGGIVRIIRQNNLTTNLYFYPKHVLILYFIYYCAA